jgi:pimeloyl-ACP methyl ester carboxylesterase
MPGSTQATTWTTARAADALPAKQRVRLGEVDLAYLSAGPQGGPLVLWVHGFPANAYLWRRCLAPVAEAGYRSIASDLLGLGESAGPQSGDFSLRGQARLLDRLLEGWNVGDVRLVGMDVGGTVCLALSVLHPARVKGIVLVDPLAGALPFFGLGLAGALARWGYGQAVLEVWRAKRGLARATILEEGRGSMPRLDSDLFLRPLLADPESRARALAFLAAVRSTEVASIHEEFLRQAPPPVLVCRSGDGGSHRGASFEARGEGRSAGSNHGSTDRDIPIPGSHELTLPGRLDWIIAASPEPFLQILIPFLKAVRRAPEA